MSQKNDEHDPYSAPEFVSRVEELMAQGYLELDALTITDCEQHKEIYIPPGSVTLH